MFSAILNVILWTFVLVQDIEESEAAQTVVGRQKRSLISSFPIHTPDFAVVRQAFVDAHNQHRREVSPSASNMRMLSWDEELADFATNYTKLCVYEHSDKDTRVTSQYTSVGENLYRGDATPSNVGTAATQQWYDEVAHYTFSTASCQTGQQCGHYTQVVWADSYKVGCGMAECRDFLSSGVNGYFVSCNYAPSGNVVIPQDDGSILELQPYTSGTACSSCPDAFPACSNNLCVNGTAPTAQTTVTSESNQETATTHTAVEPGATVSTPVLGAGTEEALRQTDQPSATNVSASQCNPSDCGSPAAVVSCTGTSQQFTCVCATNYVNVAAIGGNEICSSSHRIHGNWVFMLFVSTAVWVLAGGFCA